MRQIKPDQLKDYQAKFLKLIPLEFVVFWTGYTTTIDALDSSFEMKKWLTAVTAVALLIFLPVYMASQLKIKCKNHKIASMISLAAWVYTYPLGPFSYWEIWYPAIVLTVGGLAALGLPAIYKPNGESSNKKKKKEERR